MTMENYRDLPSGMISRARQLRRDRTEAEDRLWYALRERLPGYKWRFQTPFHPYYADFVCMKARLVIEVDGGQHDRARGYDDRRTRHFEGLGYQVLRFWNHEVLGNTDGVIYQISLFIRERAAGRSCSQHDLNSVRHCSPVAGGAQRRKSEGDQALSPSPSHSAAPSGPHPLPVGEGKSGAAAKGEGDPQ